MRELPERVKNALGALDSEDLASRVQAVEELAACSSEVAASVAAAFEKDQEARHLIFERLGRFGSVIVAPMQRVYQEAVDEELKLMSASALLYLGSDIGVASLMTALTAGHPRLCTAAISLAAAGVAEAAAPVEQALAEVPLSDTKTLECLVSSLRQLGSPLSERTRLRLSGVEPGWLRDSLLG